ncbi:MAG: hypothetical protein GXP47_11230 [Acidobacteria bacterium]|nr:hypothetical protein [Acidobacteriota bacterium]
MRSQRRHVVVSLLTVVGLVVSFLWLTTGLRAETQGPEPAARVQANAGTAFTYQGQLLQSGNPANGQFDFEFRLFDTASGGSQVGSTVTRDDVPVSNGLFTVDLDFGAGVFKGDARWLQIAVRPGTSTGSYTTLSPRQRLAPVPYALALPGVWTEQTSGTPNIVAGYEGNMVVPDKVGVTIGGGGASGGEHMVSGDYGTVGGGLHNRALADYSTVAGGNGNEAVGFRSTVGGGGANSASGQFATIAGGEENTTQGDQAVIGGGLRNNALAEGATIAGGKKITVTADYGTVGGGVSNLVEGLYATIGGGAGNIAMAETSTVAGGATNLALGPGSTIGGGDLNRAEAQFATIAGGSQITVTADYGTVGGGTGNNVKGSSGTIGGGVGNLVQGSDGTIGGGAWNSAWTSATVGGGFGNGAYGEGATVAGGTTNFAEGDYTSVPGGFGARAPSFGQLAYASGGFSDDQGMLLGSAQYAVYVLRNEVSTQGQAWTALFLDGASQRISVPRDGATTFDILVVARARNGASAGWTVQGVIENTGGTTQMVGSPAVRALSATHGWDVQAVSDDANDALVVQVMNPGAGPVRWVAVVRTAEVMWLATQGTPRKGG